MSIKKVKSLNNIYKKDIYKRKQCVKQAVRFLEKATKYMPPPISFLISKEYNNNSYLILISCLLSLRARDPLTYKVSKKLFSVAKTPQEIVSLSLSDLESIIYSINYYKTKAKTIKHVTEELIKRFNGKVPQTSKELLSIKGIGHKTANLVLSVAFDTPAICVDTHVHRIANFLGWVQTDNPYDTEKELELVVPKSQWIKVNYLLVAWGQNMGSDIILNKC